MFIPTTAAPCESRARLTPSSAEAHPPSPVKRSTSTEPVSAVAGRSIKGRAASVAQESGCKRGLADGGVRMLASPSVLSTETLMKEIKRLQ